MDSWYPLAGKLAESVHTPCNGINGIYKNAPDYPDWEPIRQSMGYTLHYANRMNLVSMKPRNDLASTQYCLANPGEEYLIYMPEGGKVTVDLVGIQGQLSVEWFIPLLNRTLEGSPVEGGNYRVFTAPFTGDCVIYLKKCNEV